MKEQLAYTGWNLFKFQSHSGMMVKRKISSTLQTIAHTSCSICSQLYNSQMEEVGKYSYCSLEKLLTLSFSTALFKIETAFSISPFTC
jgi:hypothetical protein